MMKNMEKLITLFPKILTKTLTAVVESKFKRDNKINFFISLNYFYTESFMPTNDISLV